MMNDIFHISSEKLFVETVVNSIHSRIMKKLLEGGIFRLALSGGSTPGPIYSALAVMRDIDWSRVEIYEVDERYVNKEDHLSNYFLLRNTLIDLLEMVPARFVFFDSTYELDEALEKVEGELDASDSEFFDLVLLGIGSDGHIASLFPGSAALRETRRWVAHTQTDRFDGRDRMTLTFPALESSKEIFFLVRGKAKREVLESVYQQGSTLPAARLVQLERSRVFYADL